MGLGSTYEKWASDEHMSQVVGQDNDLELQTNSQSQCLSANRIQVRKIHKSVEIQVSPIVLISLSNLLPQFSLDIGLLAQDI